MIWIQSGQALERNCLTGIHVSDLTSILSEIERGDPTVVEQLLPIAYDELRKLAASTLSQAAKRSLSLAPETHRPQGALQE